MTAKILTSLEAVLWADDHLHGEALEGTIQTIRDTDANALYLVQHDADEEGNETEIHLSILRQVEPVISVTID